MVPSYRLLTPFLLLVILLSPATTPTALANCSADSGDPDRITSDGVTVTCDISDPNPFTTGIGSQQTNTNLTVDIATGSRIEATGTGVTLAEGAQLTNEGSVTGTTNAVAGTPISGSDAVTITNDGTLTGSIGAGVDLGSGLLDAVLNNTGEISGNTLGVRLTQGEIDNSGTISASGDGSTAVDLGNGSVLINSGTISGTTLGVADNGGEIDNRGRIEAAQTALRLVGSEFDNSSEIEVTGADGVAIEASGGSLSNAGDIASAGFGVDLSGSASFDNSGTLTATDSGVRVADGSSLTNSGTVTSSGGAAVIATGGVTVTNAGTLSGSTAAVELRGGGNTLVLQSGSRLTGGVTVVTEAGVDPSDNLALEGQGNESSNFSGFNLLTMRGNSWTLSGNVFARNAAVEAGRLNIDGILDTRNSADQRGSITLSAGELGGVGTVIADVNNTAGKLVAGNPVGTLRIDGNYNQSAGASLRVTSSANASLGRVEISGAADLAGTVEVDAGSDGIYEFLVADDGISGSFDELVVNGRALVTLVSTDTTVSFVRASTTVEDNMVHAALDAAVLTLDGLWEGGRYSEQSGPWVKALGHYGDRDEIDGVAGGDFTIGGGMAGFDWQFGDGAFRAGFGGGYTTTDLDIDDGGDGEADNVVYGAYLGYAGERFHGGVVLSGGSNEFEHSRSIFVTDRRSTAQAEYDGDSIGLRLSFGASLPMQDEWRENWVFEPELRADYLALDLDPYVEEGGTGLEIQTRDDIEAAEFGGLFTVRRTSDVGLGIAPRVHVGVVHRIAIDDREWTATDAASGSRLLLPGDDNEITAFRFGVGTDIALGRHWQASLDYLGEVGDDAQGHSVIGGIWYRFSH